MLDTDRRKRARLQLMEPVEDELNEDLGTMDDAVSILSDGLEAPPPSGGYWRGPPKSFICPLSMEIMFDPVLDAEGNTFERRALLEWLKEHRTSPVSRQPLNDRMVIPNNALRDAIHEFMGSDWVARKMCEHTQQSTESSSKANPDLNRTARHRAKIDSFLQSTSSRIGGLDLRLNEQGCTAFKYDNITIVLDVPEQVGVFCLYTRGLVPKLTDPMKDRLLELNFLQGDTRGGCLSVKKHDSGDAEVMFSYTDRVPEISAQDFSNILLNFVETAVSLRAKLLKSAGGEFATPKNKQEAVTSNTGISPNTITTTPVGPATNCSVVSSSHVATPCI